MDVPCQPLDPDNPPPSCAQWWEVCAESLFLPVLDERYSSGEVAVGRSSEAAQLRARTSWGV